MILLRPVLIILSLIATCHLLQGQPACVPTSFKRTAILKNWKEAAAGLSCNLPEKSTYAAVNMLVDTNGNCLKIRLHNEGDGFLISPLTEVMQSLEFTPAVGLNGKKAASWYVLPLYITEEGCLELAKNDHYLGPILLPVPLNMLEVKQAVGYPEEARSADRDGMVVIRVLIKTSTGKVISHKTMYSDGEVFENPILREINNLRFKPIKQGARVPEKCWVNIPFNFYILPEPNEKKLEVALEKARALAAEGDWGKAAKKYKELTDAQPTNYIFWVEKGYCEYQLKDVKKAKLSFAFAEANPPRFTHGPTLRTVFFPVYLAYRNDCTSPLVPAMYSLLRNYNLIDDFDFWVGMPSYEN